MWHKALITPAATIKSAIEQLDRTAMQILLVVDSANRLLGTVSDGDIRRALIAGKQLTDHVDTLFNSNPFFVIEGTSAQKIKELMIDNKIRQVPIVDASKSVVGLSLWEDFNEPTPIKNKLLIMAGGRGIRMLPLTNDLPKPLCKVGDKPILEHIIQRAKRQGLKEILISINYLGEQIEDYFGDGSKFGVKIDYIKEEEPIGTAGALGLIDKEIEYPLFVMNGDLITDVNFIGLLDFHNRNKSCGTMAVRRHEYQVPFGVVSLKGSNINKIEEKPKIHSLINAGLYLIDAKMLRLVEGTLYLDMPELFQKAINMNWKILAYPIYEQWFDVGTPTDLEKVHEAFDGE